MKRRREHPISLWRLVPFLAAASLLVGCTPPPEPQQTESPETEVHKKDHHGRHRSEDADAPSSREEDREEPSPVEKSRNGVPEKVLTVLKYVEEHHEAPAGYEGGREFHNLSGPNEESLPRRGGRGKAIAYQEWDVNRKVAGVNRGAERLITGSDGSAYYTSDHYRTFTKIR
jgi:ribonuclease T1